MNSKHTAASAFTLLNSLWFNPTLSAGQVSFNVAITAQGEEITSYQQKTFKGSFPYFDVRGGRVGGRPRREETNTACLPRQIKQLPPVFKSMFDIDIDVGCGATRAFATGCSCYPSF